MKKRSTKKRSIPRLNPYERTAQDILKHARRPLSTNEIAEFGEMSWATAKKHLFTLKKKRKTVQSEQKGKSRLWFIK